MDLSNLPIQGGFRLRGREVTRLEAFVDASFAFSLTLLVIFFDDLPDTIAELRMAMRRVPTFAACFALLMLFWAGHNRWSRRFGLDDARSILLSLALVLTVMVYVYPLRMVTSAGLAIATGGWVPSELGGLSEEWLLDLQTAFMVYGVGFGLLSWILWLLNAHALRKADELVLSSRERWDTVTEIGMHRIATLTAVASIGVSLIILALGTERANAWSVGLPMWAYGPLGALLPLYAWKRDRSRVA